MTSGGDTRSCRLFVGTSDYSYTEWIDAGFYPHGTKSGNMLPLYAGIFRLRLLKERGLMAS